MNPLGNRSARSAGVHFRPGGSPFSFGPGSAQKFQLNRKRLCSTVASPLWNNSKPSLAVPLRQWFRPLFRQWICQLFRQLIETGGTI
ncbi:MAG: hypothetical protein AAGH19_07885, partial [Pseudomonadota bacterium]